jgi:hypothetical protein
MEYLTYFLCFLGGIVAGSLFWVLWILWAFGPLGEKR